ncbi:hypothetical protein ABZT17_02430 [Streptomyces sp. NPDC005648]|uniref:hypothetical protein n=1 Tax=Streptomyces sp. NPDC005648 TaxID=3157044 RepID=UPI0033A5B944
MGERQSGGSGPGRRRVHPGAAERGGGAEVEVLLAGAMRSGAPDGEGERRAVAAFRAARDAGVHRARTRRRDDWRPREHRRARRSLRATLTLALAGLTVGGVAFAAIGTAGHSDDGHAARQRAHRPVGTTASASPAPGTPSTSATPDRPATANDTAAHCAAYEHVKGNGKALQSTAWQRLITAAGGERNVAAYCARQLEQDTPKKPKKPAQGNSTADATNSTPPKGTTSKKK